MSVKIKICGLRSEADIRYINEYRPDYAGFVFYPPSVRYVTPEQAVELSGRLSPDILPVGVFMDNSPEEILAAAESGAVKIIQLHGRTAPALVKELKKSGSLPVWEAISIRSQEDIQRAKASPADMILLDNGPGGTGERFDWTLLQDMGRDFFLAGGLNCANIREALRCRPFGVDTSSGVETDKRKDPDRIKEFIRIVREEEEIG